MAKEPFISIPLDIPDVRVLRTDLTQAGEYILTIESTLTSTTCRRCGRTAAQAGAQAPAGDPATRPAGGPQAHALAVQETTGCA